tara:strand:+ start:295 stop:612 length:318 start_codon:yes stop_codon:yes gene_type:complete
MKKKRKNPKSKLDKIIKLIKSFNKESDVRFVFSYIKIGDTIDELKSETIMNIKEDLISGALKMLIDEKVFGNPIGEQLSINELESMSKLNMFNVFNNNNSNKPEA